MSRTIRFDLDLWPSNSLITASSSPSGRFKHTWRNPPEVVVRSQDVFPTWRRREVTGSTVPPLHAAVVCDVRKGENRRPPSGGGTDITAGGGRGGASARQRGSRAETKEKESEFWRVAADGTTDEKKRGLTRRRNTEGKTWRCPRGVDSL